MSSRIGPDDTTPLRAESDNAGSHQHTPIVRGGQGHDADEQSNRAFWLFVVIAAGVIGGLLAIAY